MPKLFDTTFIPEFTMVSYAQMNSPMKPNLASSFDKTVAGFTSCESPKTINAITPTIPLNVETAITCLVFN